MPMRGPGAPLIASRRLAAQSALRVGLTETNWLALKTMRRPGLLGRSKGRVIGAGIGWRAAAAVTDAEISICERLIAAFRAATSGGDAQAASGIWAWVMDEHQRQLIAALERGDARNLAELLAGMFRSEFIWGLGGMAPGGLPDHSESRLGSRILMLKLVDSLVSLGEALGVVPAENPEQGYMGHFDPMCESALADLIKALERIVGARLTFPDIGAAYGLTVDGRLITPETPEQIYTAVRLAEAIGLHLHDRPGESLRMVEIGGGYGGACYWFLHSQQAVMRYTIVDLPTVNVLQGYFLAKAFGPTAVSFLGEPPARIAILPNSALSEVETPYDVLLNKDSMPEMPYHTMVAYLDWARSRCEGFFYSNNHEARAPFLEHPQGRVADAIEHVGGFRRRAREQSWVRPGYVEEIYATIDARG